jgi:hypothetical protein
MTNVPGQYQLLLERWKRNWERGLSEMDRFVKKGYHGFNNSWGINNRNIFNVAKYI